MNTALNIHRPCEMERQASTLAESALHLQGMDAEAFAEQFLRLAKQPSVRRIEGDGHLFRQALCFPLLGGNGNCVMPYPELPPQLVVELTSGHVLGFRINDKTPSRLSVSDFIRTMEPYLDLMTKRESRDWGGIQQIIEGRERRRIRLFDWLLWVSFSVGVGYVLGGLAAWGISRGLMAWRWLYIHWKMLDCRLAARVPCLGRRLLGRDIGLTRDILPFSVLATLSASSLLNSDTAPVVVFAVLCLDVILVLIWSKALRWFAGDGHRP